MTAASSPFTSVLLWFAPPPPKYARNFASLRLYGEPGTMGKASTYLLTVATPPRES